ncbi:MAG: peptidase M23 [Armatimonadetes bacterium]|nr:peptidase M23 [Armatimonadota bacterium]
MRVRRIISGLGTLLVLLTLPMLPGASGQGLWGRLHSNRAQKAAVQERLKNLKAEQATRRNALTAAQQDAREAKVAYNKAKGQLDNTRAKLRGARKELAACTARLDKHSAAVSARVKVIYEVGEPSYLEVLLDATSFSDFVERADYMQRVTDRDADLLVRFTADKKRADDLRHQLEEAESRERRETAELNRIKAEEESKAAAAERLLKKANSDRAAAEQQLEELEKASNEIEAMLADLQRGRGSYAELRYSGTWSGWGSAPISAGYHVSSGFGYRVHPISGRRSFHDGVDLACGYGTPIHAAASGRVVHAGWYGAYGMAIIVDHGSGWSTLYGHCSSLAVGAGQSVAAGQVIGSVGSTGYSTGPHLHFSVRYYGSPRSPGGAY